MEYFRENDKVGTDQLKWLRAGQMLSHVRKMNDTELSQFVQETIDDFDFLGIVERMEESLVLLSFMLDLPVTDVLYTNAKVAGNMIMRAGEKECRKVGYHRPLLPSMEAWLASEEWNEAMRVDNMFYDAVNRSIDHTIKHSIGRDRFDARMHEFRTAKAALDEYCADKIITICGNHDHGDDENVELSKCYHRDIGCGYECIDELAILTSMAGIENMTPAVIVNSHNFETYNTTIYNKDDAHQ